LAQRRGDVRGADAIEVQVHLGPPADAWARDQHWGRIATLTRAVTSLPRQGQEPG